MLESVTQKQPITQNLHFKTFSGVFRGEKVFVKSAVSEEHTDRILKEAAGLQAMFELDPLESHYKVPSVLYMHEDTIITTWAEGRVVKEDFTVQTAQEYCEKLRDIYKYIDSRTTSGKRVTRINQPGKRNTIERIMEELQLAQYEKSIDASLVERLAAYIQASLPEIETRFTHGDLQPGNILVTEDGELSIVDCESCSWLWPRHYNIVNFTFNYLLNASPEMSTILIKNLYTYIDELGLDISQEMKQLNFSAAVRAIQAIYEILAGVVEEGKGELPEHVSQHIPLVMKAILDNQLFTKPFEG